MIWLSEIKIGNRASFGGVFQNSIVLPSKISKIKAFAVYAEADSTSVFKEVEESVILREPIIGIKKTVSRPSLNKKTLRGIVTPQIATLSITLNSTNVVLSNVPVCDINNLNKPSFNANKIGLQEILEVPKGSVLNILIEEKDLSPFVDNDYVKKITSNGKINNPYPEVEYTNSYSVKICVEYDK